MKRKHIRGWTWRLLGYNIEFVTIHHILRVIAVYDKTNRNLIKRIEI